MSWSSRDVAAVYVSENRGDTVTGLSTNLDCSHVVVGGRNILKVYSIEEGFFKEKYNLRVGRHPNLNHSAADVAWSSLDENLVATATTSGSVVTWRLDKSTKNKINQVYHAHKRTTHTVCFHKTEVSYLLSGSQDATAKLFDLRRPHSYTTSFETQGNVDPIRDVEFSPHSANIFVAVDEGGNVRFWDIRNSARPVSTFTAHAGPVYSVDFHHTSKSWLATGARDNVIKVWTYDSNTFRISDPQGAETIQTTCSVNLVRWRPGRAWQLASSALVTDCSVHVWDLRRPYIPFASFDHKDIVTGICWLNDPHTFLSCGKDMLLKLNYFKSASRPASYASPISLDVSPQGDIAWTVCKNPNLSQRRFGSPQKTSIATYLGIPGAAKNHEEFVAPQNSESHMNMFMRTDNNPVFSQEWFVETAKQYKLRGLSFSQLCQHNADVAAALDRPQIEATWRMLVTLFNFSPEQKRPVEPDEKGEEKQHMGRDGGIGSERVSFGLEGVTETETEEDPEPVESSKFTPAASTAPMNTVHSDFFFGTAEHNSKDLVDFEAFMDDASNAWRLQREAFEPKLDLLSPDQFTGNGMEEAFVSPTENGQSLTDGAMEPEVVVRPPTALTVSLSPRLPLTDPIPLVRDMLEHYAEAGDVQMAVSVLLVLGERGKNLMEHSVQEHWYLSYIDLLEHFELWTVSAMVIKLCPLGTVSSLSQLGTSVIVGCGRCEKISGKKGWFCDRCKLLTPGCSVCQNPVRSLWSWCQVCGHGGHMDHLRTWFSKYQICPAGCGHKCEYELFLRN